MRNLSSRFGSKISHRIFLGFGLAAFLTLVVAGVSIYYVRNVEGRLTQVAERDRILITEALKLQVSIEQESDGIQAYLLAGDEIFLETFEQGNSDYSTKAESLRSMIESQEESKLLFEIDKLHSDFLKVAQEQITLHDQGFPGSAIFLWQIEGNEVKSILNNKLTDFISLEEGRILAHVEKAKSEKNRALLTSSSLVALMWLLVILGGVRLGRTITEPIKRLVSAAQSVGKGDLNTRVEVPGSDELATLGRAMNEMTQELDSSRGTTEQLLEKERRRVEQLRTINEVGRKISSILSLDELLPYVVSSLQETFEYYNVNIFLLDPGLGDLILKAGSGGYKGVVPIGLSMKVTEGIAGWVVQAGEPLLANDVSQEPRYRFVEELADTRSELAVPIKVGDEILGVLDVESAELDAFDEMDLFTAQTLADQVAIAVENARLYQETRDMAVLEERNRMAREIHDTLAQGFTGIILQLEAAEQALGEDAGKAQEHLDRARSLARESLSEARRSVWSLRPQALEQLPLAEAVAREIDKFSQSSGVKTNLDISGERYPLSPDAESAVLRICQESLANVRKHAKASQADINLVFEERAVRLSIPDNGIGFNAEAPTEGAFGLIGMRERARLLGGTLVVESERGKGTLVEVMIPIK